MTNASTLSVTRTEPLFFHGETTDNYKFTVAGRQQGSSLEIGMALCSPSDIFIKKVGRHKAYGRILSHNDKGYLRIQPRERVVKPKHFVNYVKHFTEGKNNHEIQKIFNLRTIED